jgi:GPI-anchor transamidase subunit S
MADKGERAEACGQNPAVLNIGEPALKLHLVHATESFAFGLSTNVAEARARIPAGAGVGVAKSLAEDLHGLFRDEQIAVALQTVSVTSHTHNAQAFLKSQPYDLVSEIEHQANRAYKQAPEYHLTFSLLTASGAPSSWDVQAALKEHMHPVVQALSSVADFELTTQVQLYATLPPTVQPGHMEGQNGTFLQQNDLPAFVNAAEWPLAPSLGEGPTLNFILYVPAKDEIPLNIQGTDEHSWLIPQWGAIQILNPPLQPHPFHGTPMLPDTLDEGLLDKTFENFASQLLSLLGVSQPQHAGKARPMRLRLDAYKRLSALSLHLKAASSLGSLARLAQRLSEIPIPRNVADLLDEAIANLAVSNRGFLESRWDDALDHAKKAFKDSEKAFFDKSMVGQVYFPDEHKVSQLCFRLRRYSLSTGGLPVILHPLTLSQLAVYMPLLGPVAVPLIISLLREVKQFMANKRKPSA